MRKPEEYFSVLINQVYQKAGMDVDYAIRVDEQEKTICLLFQGSSSETDWKNNFRFPKKPYKQAEKTLYYAGGWCDAWKSCNDQIMKELIKLYVICSDWKVLILGYSYGGAMALLAAEDFYFRTHIKPSVITFGAPKPLWGKKTAEYVRGCCNYVKQYANVNDVVTYCPPIPGYHRIRTDKVGKPFKLKNLFNPWQYHQMYGEAELYDEK